MPIPGAGERRSGFPRSDVERAARHYGLTLEEAKEKLANGEITLPPRGSGISTVSQEKPATRMGFKRTLFLMFGSAIGMIIADRLLHWWGTQQGEESSESAISGFSGK